MNDKDMKEDCYKGSYNYMIDQIMGLTVDRKSTVKEKKQKKKELPSIIEEEKQEDEIDSDFDRKKIKGFDDTIDSDEEMKKMD